MPKVCHGQVAPSLNKVGVFFIPVHDDDDNIDSQDMTLMPNSLKRLLCCLNNFAREERYLQYVLILVVIIILI